VRACARAARSLRTAARPRFTYPPPHARTHARARTAGRQQRFLRHGGDLLELQRLTQPTPCSWFVDQAVLSDGALLVASRVDPLFFLLPLLARNGGRFSPMSQYLAPSGPHDAALPVLQGVRGLHASMAAACDVNASLGPGEEERLYRLNRPRAVRHLAARAARLGRVLQRHGDSQQARLRAAMGTFVAASTVLAGGGGGGGSGSSSSSSSGGGDGGTSAAAAATAAPVPAEYLTGALSIMTEYLADEWTEEVAAACGCVRVCAHVRVCAACARARRAL
jgi:hypothetical protein